MGPTYYSFPSLLIAQNGRDTQKLTNSFPQEEGDMPLNSCWGCADLFSNSLF